jgi:beta-lactamase superfamily II metal-dependent hydrolase
LARLAPKWDADCKRAGILAGQGAPIVNASWRRDQLLGFNIDVLATTSYSRDKSSANGASIVCIATYGSHSALLLADAPAESVIAGLDRVGRGPHTFAAVKLSHHGSRFNTNLLLCERIQSRNWLVSTDGAKFEHPDPEAIARVIVTQRKPQFVFNYVTDFVSDIIVAAGKRYTVKLPRRLPSGSYATQNAVKF